MDNPAFVIHGVGYTQLGSLSALHLILEGKVLSRSLATTNMTHMKPIKLTNNTSPVSTLMMVLASKFNMGNTVLLSVVPIVMSVDGFLGN